MKTQKVLRFALAFGILASSPAGTGPPPGDFPLQAHYRIDRPGYLVSWPRTGEVLPRGTYRYRFTLRRLPGHLPGMLASANDAARLEVYDLTRRERIASRAVQQEDLTRWRRGGERSE